jgi:hypothetical protein
LVPKNINVELSKKINEIGKGNTTLPYLDLMKDNGVWTLKAC